MKNPKMKVRAVLTVLMTVTALVAVSPSAAFAVSNCNSACDGADPTALGCDKDAVTAQSLSDGDHGYLVELRYSPSCRSAWARGPAYLAFRVESYKGSTLRTYADYYSPTTSTPTGTRFTRMVNDKSLLARACVGGTNQPVMDWACTPKY